MNSAKEPLEITVLGVAASGPTRSRNASAFYGKTYQQSFLLDTGENCQKRIMELNLPIMVDFIVVSHRHTDHFAGLAPLLQTMYRMQRVETLNIYVPELDFFKKYLELFRINFKFINLIAIHPGVTYCQKDLYLEFFKRTHGLNEVATYGVKLTSTSDVKYDKTKLQGLTTDEVASLFKNQFLDREGLRLELEDYVVSNDNLINCYYTSDGLFDKQLFEKVQKEETGSLFITECTHIYPEDLINTYKTEHTHFNSVLEIIGSTTPNFMMYLVHLGEKITPALIKKTIKKHDLDHKNIYFGVENAVLKHNYRLKKNQIHYPKLVPNEQET